MSKKFYLYNFRIALVSTTFLATFSGEVKAMDTESNVHTFYQAQKRSTSNQERVNEHNYTEKTVTNKQTYKKKTGGETQVRVGAFGSPIIFGGAVNVKRIAPTEEETHFEETITYKRPLENTSGNNNDSPYPPKPSSYPKFPGNGHILGGDDKNKKDYPFSPKPKDNCKESILLNQNAMDEEKQNFGGIFLSQEEIEEQHIIFKSLQEEKKKKKGFLGDFFK